MKTYPLESEHLDLKGQYWFGDPCYVFPEDKWQELCRLMWPNGRDFDDTNAVRVVEVDGEKCYLIGTAYGDGCYPLVKNENVVGELGVDAGMLSMIPMKLVKSEGWGKTARCGVKLTLDGTVQRISVDDGDFTYGNIRMITSDNYDDDTEQNY